MSADRGQPGFAELLDWLEDRLEPSQAAEVAAAVAGGDVRTRGTVEWLRGFLAAAQALPLAEPPPIVRQSLAQAFDRWRRARAELDQQPRLVRAQLLFDSREDVAAAGLRAVVSGGEVVHLAYTMEAGDLLLDVYEAGQGRVRLEGQVLLAEPGPPVFEVSVSSPGCTVRTIDGDELGRFSLREVPQARCQLRATNGVITIVAELNLAPGAASSDDG